MRLGETIEGWTAPQPNFAAVMVHSYLRGVMGNDKRADRGKIEGFL